MVELIYEWEACDFIPCQLSYTIWSNTYAYTHTHTHTAYVTVSVPSSAYMFFIARVDADTLLSVNLAYYYEMLSVN